MIKEDQEYVPELESVTNLVQERAAELGITVEHFFPENEEQDIAKTLEYFVNSSEKPIYDYVLVSHYISYFWPQ